MRHILAHLASPRPRPPLARHDRPTGRTTRPAAGFPALLLALLAALVAAPSAAQDDTRQKMQGLDEQVQEIKSDVLGIAAELSRLEERLLYPSDTQVSVFVELEEGAAFEPDSVQVRIDGEPVAHHIYSFKEVEALQKGGVQRIYTGNLPTGEHRLEVEVAGRSGGGEFARTEGFGFDKGVGPELVGITLGGGGIQIGSW